jgi:hypothetical protein
VGEGVPVAITTGVSVGSNAGEGVPGRNVSVAVTMTVLVAGVRNSKEMGVSISGRTGSTIFTVGKAAKVASGSSFELMSATTLQRGAIFNANSPARHIILKPTSRIRKISLQSLRSRSGIFMSWPFL